MYDLNWVLPRYMREILKSWVRRIIVETLERYNLIPESNVDPASGVQLLEKLHTFLNNNYPNAFKYNVLEFEDGSKTLVIRSDTEAKISQLKNWLILNKDLTWVTYFQAEDVINGDYNWGMLINSYDVTQ